MKWVVRYLGILLRICVTVAIVATSVWIFTYLRSTGPEPRKRPATRSLPLVQPFEVETGDYLVQVASQGNILPQTSSQLTAEVPGRISSISPQFRDGAGFSQGEELVTLEPRDYEHQLARAKAALIRAESALKLAQAQTDQARKDWERFGTGEASDLALKLPQLREAEANLLTAKTDVEEAELNLSRCHIRAPYDGRTLQKAVDVGQYVSPGALLGEIYSTAAFEVRLPLREDQLPYLDLPLPGASGPGASVTLRPSNGDGTWTARLQRTEASIDPRSRQLFVVARLDLKPGAEPLLPSGTFVEGQIQGRNLSNVMVIPRSAVRSGNVVMKITPQSTLDFVPLDLVYSGDRDVIVAQPHPSLPVGSRISLTPLPFASDGEAVTVEGAAPPPSPKGRAKGKRGPPSNRSPNT